jgi:hypothetical protein
VVDKEGQVSHLLLLSPHNHKAWVLTSPKVRQSAAMLLVVLLAHRALAVTVVLRMVCGDFIEFLSSLLFVFTVEPVLVSRCETSHMYCCVL